MTRTFAEKMKVNPVIVLGCLALATIISFLVVFGSRREPESISISVFDGTGLSAQDILNAAYSLSSELPVVINFHRSGNSPDSITAMSRKVVANSRVDSMLLELIAGEFILNEELVSEKELRSRMETYAESARLTESVPFLLLAARNDSSGAQLTNLLQILCDARISHIIPVFKTEAANKASIASLITSRVG